MVARVVINHMSRSMDKMFDYLIPDGMTVEIGTCVTVPFGVRNKVYEAYVMEVLPSTRVARLKELLEVDIKGRVFDEKTKELILWMRERYLCAYIDAVHAVVPAGSRVTSSEYVRLTEQEVQLTKTEQTVCDYLRDNGGRIRTEALKEVFKTTACLGNLAKKGAVVFEYDESRGVSDKLIRAARLTADAESVREYIKKREKRAPAQARVLNILLSNPVVAVEDLKMFADTSASVIRTLAQNGMLAIEELETYREPPRLYHKKEAAHCLTGEQEDALSAIQKSLDEGEYRGFLLHGVTGSGKTEVFLQAIDHVLRQGRQAIVLVPEISMTPQTVNRFISRFPGRVAVFHSGLSLGEKYDQWKKMRDGKADIVIGARSAVFAPFERIGIIVLDEEHSDTYKSEMLPRYDTQEVAEYRCRQHGAAMVLASATPSVGSFLKAETGKLTLLKMEHRINHQMPHIGIVDMRAEFEAGNKSMFSRALQKEIGENLSRGEQTILFLNRRGFSTFVSCRECGYVAECPNCNISLTYHKTDNTLRCHYCGHTIPNPTECPSCSSRYIRYFGGGTQRVEDEVRRLFPEASLIRMDVDTTGKKQSHEKILSRFEKERIDILIGTQMVSKGLDFENVTLVGVISADTMLNLDDFRSGERAFGILEQVAGRAGRGEKPGRALIQTYSPEHEAVVCARDHDYMRFYLQEKEIRRIMWYPPYCDLVSVVFSGVSAREVQLCAKEFAKRLEGIKRLPMKTVILGPIAAVVAKIKNKYRWQILIKAQSAQALNHYLIQAREACTANDNYRRVSIAIDKNPSVIL